MTRRNFISSLIAAGLALAVMATTALAAPAYILVGDATIVAGGHPGQAAQIRSDALIAPSYGGVSIPLPAGIAWSDLATLQTDYNVTDDNCGGGSPRFQIRVDTDGDGISNGSVRVAIGPSPSFTGCAPGWQSTGNLIGNEDAGRYDYSVFGGSPYTTYSNAPASVLAGTVVGIFLVVDGSWSAAATGGDGEQTVLVDNVTINSDVVTFEPNTPTSTDQCKNGGWQTVERADGSPFYQPGRLHAVLPYRQVGVSRRLSATKYRVGLSVEADPILIGRASSGESSEIMTGRVDIGAFESGWKMV